MMERIIEKTDDGSATLFVPELNEHYHSTKGARTESQHIFIDMGLKASSATTPHILDNICHIKWQSICRHQPETKPEFSPEWCRNYPRTVDSPSFSMGKRWCHTARTM